MELGIDRVRDKHFKAQASLEQGGLLIELRGTADIPARESLQKLLSQAQGAVEKHKVSKVTVDLCEVEFMNSSCFKDFVSWINATQDDDGQPRYQIHFLSSPDMHWQKRSLHALRSFAPDVVSIEVVS